MSHSFLMKATINTGLVHNSLLYRLLWTIADNYQRLCKANYMSPCFLLAPLTDPLRRVQLPFYNSNYRPATSCDLTPILIDWLQELKHVKLKFQQSYLRNGIKNFEAQRPFLEQLAALYEQKYAAENKWPDALKVRLSYIQQRLVQCHTKSNLFCGW